MRTIVLLLVTLTATAAMPQQAPVEYRFDEVKRKVTFGSAKQQTPAAVGQKAQSGQQVETGWFSYALLASERYHAKFEIYSTTSVELASGTPGVILTLNRGRIHAMFDKLTGNEPRVVQTPGALLAVRGTQYSVEVTNGGETTLDVFEGTVEVRSPLRQEPLLVHATERATYSRREPPIARPMPPNTRPDGRGGPRPNQPGDHDGARAPNDPNRGPNGQPGGPHGGGPGAGAPPPPPPGGGPGHHP